MKWSKYRIILGILVLLSLVIAGCGEDTKKSRKPSQPQERAVKKAPPKSPPEVQESKESGEEPGKFVYRPGNRRDPFEPLVAVRKPLPKKREISEEELTPLQKYDVGQYRLLGVIVGKGKPTAMILAPDGKSYILQSGIKIGKNDGIVVGIDQEGVKVKEFFYDFSGEVRTGIQEIRLPTAGGD